MKKLLIMVIGVFIMSGCSNNNYKMIDLSGMTLTEIKEYTKNNNLILKVGNEYNDLIVGKLISQSIEKGSTFKKNDTLTIVISLGPVPIAVYQDNKVNELGNIPIMMYHSIVNKTSDSTPYTGGNVDKDGYNRTAEAFRNDLEMYYEKGYRMIRLSDYVNGLINVELGKSPIVLTFDDGNNDNFNVMGLDDKGNLIIDPNCAVGILQEFKKKYPTINVTATFFLNSKLFGQSKYNDQILKWLVDNGYDVGNHTKNHLNLSSIDTSKVQEEIAYMYKLFDSIIPKKYTNIIALPYGSPGKKTHSNFPYILNGSYEGYSYQTESTLRVSWDANYSPFHKDFDKTFIKRVRAWDDNGIDYDIQRVFGYLDKNRFISDGDINTIVINDDKNFNTNIEDKKIIKY